MSNQKQIDIQKLAGDLVGAHVYANVGGMVEYILSKSLEDRNAPFSWDDIDTRPDPSDWDVDRLNAHLVEVMGTTWEDVTGEPFERYEPKEEAIADARLWIQYYEDLPAPVEELTLEQLVYQVERIGDTWRDVTGGEMETEEEHLDRLEDQADQVRDYIRDNADPAEIFEWYAVSDWLASELGDQGEIILDAGGLAVWGRQTTGQAIKLDWCIQQIAWAQHERYGAAV